MIAAWLNPKEDYITQAEKESKEEGVPEVQAKKVRFRRYGSLPARDIRPVRAIKQLGSLFRRK